MIFHIATESEWNKNRDSEFYVPEKFKAEGFIHCSTNEQIENTANRIFHAHQKIMLLCIDADKENEFTKFENLEGGTELYPHLYRKLPKTSIKKSLLLLKNEKGGFTIPSF